MCNKFKITPYYHKTWSNKHFKQLAIGPCFYFTHNPIDDLWVISLNFLIWDIGFQIHMVRKYK